METVGKAVLILPPRISSSAAKVVDCNKPQPLPPPTAQQAKTTRATEKPKPARPTQDLRRAKNKDKDKDRPKRSAPAPIVIPSRSRSGSESDSRREAVDKRRAVLRALEVIASSSRVLEPKHAVARRIGVQ